MKSKILRFALATLLSFWPAHQSGPLNIVASGNPNPAPPPPPSPKMLYMMMAAQGFDNPATGQSLLNKAYLRLEAEYPSLRGRIRMNHLGGTCRDQAGEICDTVSIAQERSGRVIKYQVFFECKAHRSGEKSVDAERIETAAPKIARLISQHDSEPHPTPKP